MEFDKTKTLITQNPNLSNHEQKNLQSSQSLKEHVILLLDTSASMDESIHIPALFAGEKEKYINKREMLKKAVDKMLSVSDGAITEYTIIEFESYQTETIKRTSNMDEVRERFKLHSGGSTKMAQGITFALTKDPDRIVLFTDGQPDPPKEAVIESAREAKKQNVVIDTIGIGDADQLLLEQIAEITGGVYTYVQTDRDLEDIFQALETSSYLQIEDQSIKL